MGGTQNLILHILGADEPMSAQSIERRVPITTHPDVKDGFQHFRHGCTPPLTGLSIAEMDKEDGLSIAGIPNTSTILNVN